MGGGFPGGMGGGFPGGMGGGGFPGGGQVRFMILITCCIPGKWKASGDLSLH